jgi:hypothetical protein
VAAGDNTSATNIAIQTSGASPVHILNAQPAATWFAALGQRQVSISDNATVRGAGAQIGTTEKEHINVILTNARLTALGFDLYIRYIR